MLWLYFKYECNSDAIFQFEASSKSLMKNTCITAYYAAWMAAALLHIWSIGMKSTGQEALESQVLWESTTGGLWTCKYLSHILTKTFLFSKHGGGSCVKRCQIKRRPRRYAVSPPDYQKLFLLITDPYHNIHTRLPVHLQWSEQHLWHTECSRSFPAIGGDDVDWPN